MGKTDILEAINRFSVIDRLQLVEDILRTIRETEVRENYSGENLLAFAGIMDDEEAMEMKEAVADARQVDENEW